MSVIKKAVLAKNASRSLAILDSNERTKALLHMANAIELNRTSILEANQKDLNAADDQGITGAMRKRLALSENKLSGMAEALRQIAHLPDSLGQVIETINRPNGLIIKKIRVPFGVIGIIYESRPNVTSDAAGICIKSGNAVILRGGSEAYRSNRAIANALRTGLETSQVSPECIQFVEIQDRSEVATMMNLRGQIDLLIPRGGPGLIQATIENASIPVIETGTGNCHTYIDSEADLEMAHSIVLNAKLDNPAVCNAMETLLVHEKIASKFLPKISKALVSHNVELRGCSRSIELSELIKPASKEDWDDEYLDLILAIRIVSSTDEAINHISKHGTLHSEAIVTENSKTALRFSQSIDAATVYINTSTRFTDGGEFGFGAEMGISTQKLHARGPMGIDELTTYKYVIEGDGQIR